MFSEQAYRLPCYMHVQIYPISAVWRGHDIYRKREKSGRARFSNYCSLPPVSSPSTSVACHPPVNEVAYSLNQSRKRLPGQKGAGSGLQSYRRLLTLSPTQSIRNRCSLLSQSVSLTDGRQMALPFHSFRNYRLQPVGKTPTKRLITLQQNQIITLIKHISRLFQKQIESP